MCYVILKYSQRRLSTTSNCVSSLSLDLKKEYLSLWFIDKRVKEREVRNVRIWEIKLLGLIQLSRDMTSWSKPKLRELALSRHGETVLKFHTL